MIQRKVSEQLLYIKAYKACLSLLLATFDVKKERFEVPAGKTFTPLKKRERSDDDGEEINTDRKAKCFSSQRCL